MKNPAYRIHDNSGKFQILALSISDAKPHKKSLPLTEKAFLTILNGADL